MVTADTVKNLVLDAGVVYVNYGVVGERLLGATTGGNTFVVEREVRVIEVDGVKGKTKGLRRIVTEDASLVVRLKEMSTENLVLALAGAAAAVPVNKTRVPAEYLGTGTAGVDTFTANHAPILGSEQFYVNGVAVNWKRGVDYTIVGTAINTLAAGTLGIGEKLTVGYVYLSGGAQTHDTITSGGEIALSDYLANVALVAKVSGTAQPVVVLIHNALADGGLNANFSDKDELVLELTLSAHYDPAALTDPIYEIRYPVVV